MRYYLMVMVDNGYPCKGHCLERNRDGTDFFPSAFLNEENSLENEIPKLFQKGEVYGEVYPSLTAIAPAPTSETSANEDT
jgi:hypothetical protein